MSELAPPFREIYDGLRTGTVIPFLGSGASLPGSLNAWTRDVADRYPKAEELAEALATQASYPDGAPYDLALVAQYFDGMNGRVSLTRFLHDIFGAEHPCHGLHRFIARTMSHGVIVTTNYDDLLERAFADKPYDLVVHGVDADSRSLDRVLLYRAGSSEPQEFAPLRLPVTGEERPLIYKRCTGR